LSGDNQHLESKKGTFLSAPLEAGFGEVDVFLVPKQSFGTRGPREN
jgi:hypothetical protein